jgi:hypothetical protein
MNRKYSQLVSVGYVVAMVLVVFSLVDLLANTWPLTPGQINWRYGSFGLASGYVLTIVLGMGLAVAVAVGAGHRAFARVLAAISGIGGVALLITGAVYFLDALQIRGTVPDENWIPFHVGTGKALFKNGASGLAFLWIGWAGWRAAGQEAARADEKRPKDQKPLVGAASR